MKIANYSFDRASFVRQLIILLTPLTLGILEIWHPVGVANRSAFESIVPKVDWWLTLHLLQLPLFGLLALSVVLMLRKLHCWAATIARIGMGFFVVFYIALDSITGIASGLLIRNARDFSPEIQAFVSQQINLLFFNPITGGNTFSVVGVLGAFGWTIGTIAAAIALSKAGAERIPVALLILAAILFGLSHAPPTGSIGLILFFFAVVRLDSHIWNPEPNETPSIEDLSYQTAKNL
jgi:hypothetical protein